MDNFSDSMDVIRVEVLDPRLADDTLSLSSAAKLLRGTQTMLQSAAWAAVTPASILEGQKPALLSKYNKAIQLGQTHRAPFAISVLSPLSAEFDSPDDDRPFSRLAVETMANALNRLVVFCANPDFEEETLMKLIKGGISSSLCAGAATCLQALGRRKTNRRANMDGTLRAIRLAFKWSDTLTPPAGTPNSVALEPDMLDTIKQLESTLKSFVRDDFKFEGYVTQFSVAQGEKVGKIMVERMSDEKPARFAIEVSEEEFDQAIDSVRDKVMIMGLGTLVRNGAQFLVADLKEFGVEEPQTN